MHARAQLHNCKRPAIAPTQKVLALKAVAGPHLALEDFSPVHQHWGSALALPDKHFNTLPLFLWLVPDPSSKTAHVQQLLPHRRCQYWKLLLALIFLCHPFHRPTNIGALHLHCHLHVETDYLSLLHACQSPAPKLQMSIDCSTWKVPALKAVAGPHLPLAAVSLAVHTCLATQVFQHTTSLSLTLATAQLQNCECPSLAPTQKSPALKALTGLQLPRKTFCWPSNTGVPCLPCNLSVLTNYFSCFHSCQSSAAKSQVSSDCSHMEGASTESCCWSSSSIGSSSCWWPLTCICNGSALIRVRD